MKDKVNITDDSSERTVYEAIPSLENMHLRWEQQKSAVSVAERSAKKARNEASDARRKMAELERRLRGVADLERRVRELELQVRQRDETIRQRDDSIHQLSVALAEAESKIECFCCKDRPIEVVFSCGHGACRICTEKLATEERPAPGTNRFTANGPKIRVRKTDPKCSQCGESVDPCVDFYAFRS
ncbi:hypothetical protein AAVH_10401 [Aphelenchoides avenae]|nr:hypothetical protein AAVH_10401 [Aphelenchus avenae]